MKPLRVFLERWFAEVEPDEKKRAAAVADCLESLRAVSRRHTALVTNLACLKYLALDGEE